MLGNVKRNRILRALVRFSLNNRQELDQVGNVERVEPPKKEQAPATVEDRERISFSPRRL
mgnify:CR=1 FL=1